MSKYVYGIDLGTTYSCIAYQDENGMPVVIKNAEGEMTTPSVISMVEETPVVGKTAKENAVFDASYTLSLVKNKIGRVDESGNPEMIYYGDDAEHEISPTTASSYILKKLADDASKALEDSVQNVVITCPAYFSAKQREETKRAGEEAGLAVLSIIDEPTAAAIAYGCKADVEGQMILVYDLGGGTFDITVMKVEGGKFRIICSEGNHDLGGARWDQAIYDYVEEKYHEETGDQEDFSMETEQDLRIKSESAKKSLSGKTSIDISLRGENGKAKINVTREIFDDKTSVLLDETITLTKKAIAVAQGFGLIKNENGEVIGEKTIDEIIEEFDNNYDASMIGKFLLVGGSTRMPQVKERVEKEFSIETQEYEQDQAVAMGAAIYAVMCANDADEVSVTKWSDEGEKIVDYHKVVVTKSIAPAKFNKISALGGSATDIIETITNKSYGIIITRFWEEDGPDGHSVVNNLIMRDSVLPYQQTETYSLHSDDQRDIRIRLTECTSRNEYVEIPEVNIIFEQTYDIPRGLSKETPVDIQMSLQKDGILDIEIRIAGQVMTGQHKVSMD